MYWIIVGIVSCLYLKVVLCVEDVLIKVVLVLVFKFGVGLFVLYGVCGGLVMINEVLYEKFGEDGQFGVSYFGICVWMFDYFVYCFVVEGDYWIFVVVVYCMLLGFWYEVGELVLYFLCIVVQVDGQLVDFLFDMGVMVYFMVEGKCVVGIEMVCGFGVISYIIISMFDCWYVVYLDWCVVMQGDDLFGLLYVMWLIEVLKLVIVGWMVGLVWFIEWLDKNFYQFMVQMMDKLLEGVIGGNVFDYFCMMLDYLYVIVWFVCVCGCMSVVVF